MVIQLCRLARDVRLSTVDINGENKTVLNNAIAIQIDSNTVAFMEITAWGKTAESIVKYFRKGDALQIIGELRNKKSMVEGKEITNVYVLVTGFHFTYGNLKQSEKMGSE